MISRTSRAVLSRLSVSVAAALALAVALVGPATAAPRATGPGTAGTARAAQAQVSTAPLQLSDVTVVTARLRGANERPGPGDPDGRGAAAMVLLPRAGMVCYVLHVSGLDDVVAGHIHQGAAGVPGPIVVSLQLPPGPRRFFANCVEGDPAVVRAIADAPEDYYVNVHTTVFPAGAIRDQLHPLSLG
jgi:hypothetical protein